MNNGADFRVSQEHTSLELDTDRKRSELTLRLISAVIALPILGVALYLGFWAVSVVAILVGGAVGLESRQLAFHDTRKIIAAGTAGAVVGIAVFAAAVDDLGIAAGIEDGTAVAILFVIGIVLIEIAATLRFRTAETVRRNLVLSYGAIVLLAVTILPFIASMEKGREFLTLCIVVVFAADTGAYFVGKLTGKRRIVPNVSPGKTWEGLIGGIVAAVLATWSISSIFSLKYGITEIAAIGIAIAVIGFLGDLSESWIKRLAGVKDSGGLIPGHGGIMDRLDALAPNFVFIYFVARWVT